MRSSVLLLALLAPFGVSARGLRVSKDATCGGSNKYTCLESAWGNCCSQYGYCGRTSAYCGSGCNPAFGNCNSKPASSSSAVKTSTLTRRVTSSSSTKASSTLRTSSAAPASTKQPVTTDARCGPKFGGKTCMGSRWGDCCSQYSFCGSTFDYCDANTCQKGFGKCNTVSSSSRVGQSSARTSSSTGRSSSSSSSASSTSSSSGSAIKSSSTSSTSSSSSIAETSSSSLSMVSSSTSLSVPSSTSQLSSSSVVVVTSLASSAVSVTSTATISTATPQSTCLVAPGCDDLAKPFTQACSSRDDNTKCVSGYQTRCSSQIEGTILSKTPTSSTGGDACIASCTSNSACAGFWFNGGFTGEYFCTLYSAIDSVGTGFGTMFLKVCDGATPSTSSPAMSSATSSATSSIPSSVSNVPSETMSATVTSLSTSSTAVATSSASPSASSCPYSRFTQPDCTPAGTSLANACPASDKKCASGYQIKCGQAVGTTVILRYLSPTSADSCTFLCEGNAKCIGFEFSYDANSKRFICYYFSAVESFVPGSTSGAATYFKQCKNTSPQVLTSSLISSTIAVTSSSSMTESTRPATTSSSTSVVPSMSESTASSTSTATPTASPTPGLYANSCPAQNGQCVSGYQVKCATSIYQSGSTVINRIREISADECVAACTADSSCVAIQYAAENADAGAALCTLFSSVSQSGPFSTRFSSFFRGCEGAPASSSLTSSAASSSSASAQASSSISPITETSISASSVVTPSTLSISLVSSSMPTTPIPTPTLTPASSTLSLTPTPIPTGQCTNGPITDPDIGHRYLAYCNNECEDIEVTSNLAVPDFKACVRFCDGLIGDFDVAQYDRGNGVCSCGQYRGFVNPNAGFDCAVNQGF